MKRLECSINTSSVVALMVSVKAGLLLTVNVAIFAGGKFAKMLARHFKWE